MARLVCGPRQVPGRSKRPDQDPDIVARFTEATTNHHPEIPIAVTGIDYAALERHVPFADDSALRSAAAALETRRLTPASARPMVGHTVFITVAVGADGAEQEQRRTLLDTHVSYRFVVDGYPLVGPGAQIQISFAADGEVTRLIHATRMLEPGPSVAIIDRRRDSPPDLVLAGRRCRGRRPARLPGARPAQRIEWRLLLAAERHHPVVRGHRQADGDPPGPGRRAPAHLPGPPDSGHRRSSVRLRR